MKVFLLICALTSGAMCSVVGWDSALPLSQPLIHSVIPPQVKAFGYSTSQYINAIPPTYTFGYQPQVSYQPNYQIPVSHFSPFQGYNPYRPVVAPAYYPSNSFLYPSFAPVAPVSPINQVQQPEQQYPVQQDQGDEDTTVVESAEYSANPLASSRQPEQPMPESPNNAYLPPAQAPNNAYLPPSLDSRNMPAIPQIPQNNQQPTSFQEQSSQSSSQNDQGQNDEDSVSIDAA